MQVADNRHCFICGPGNPIGLKARPTCDEVSGRAWLTVVIPVDYQGWEGMAHGGIIAALLDEVSAYAAMSVTRQIVTGELKIRYLKPVPIGREIRAEAHVCERIRRSIKVDAVLTCDGETLARAEAKMVVLRAAESV
jgi:uncharacterized protein (TIGR00369 family)